MKTRTCLGLALALGLSAFPAAAQFESPLLSRLQLNLLNPGGKSLAMGGAFVSVADDSTASLANPAGLPQLKSWQIGASGKYFSFEPRLSTANYLLVGGVYQVDSFDDEAYNPKGTKSDLEFVSITGPLAPNVSVGLYRAVNLRYLNSSSDIPGGNYRSLYFNQGGGSTISLDEFEGISLKNEIYGVSVGAEFGEWLQVGIGANLQKLTYELTGPNGPHVFVANGDNGSRSDVSNPRIDTEVTVDVSSGSKAGYVAGLRLNLYEAKKVAIGAVYRKSPKFDVGYSVHATYPAFPGTVVNFRCGDGTTLGNSACGSVRLPDDYSIGISGNVFPGLLLAFELQRVKYSQLNDGYVPLFAYCVKPPTSGSCPLTDRMISQGSNDDGTVPRVGAEYTLTVARGTDINVRAGWYREPAHGMKLTLYPDKDGDRRPDPGSAPITSSVPPFSEAYQTSFNGGQNENHVSFGVGTSLGRHFSFDLAVDLAKTTKLAVLSGFYRF